MSPTVLWHYGRTVLPRVTVGLIAPEPVTVPAPTRRRRSLGYWAKRYWGVCFLLCACMIVLAYMLLTWYFPGALGTTEPPQPAVRSELRLEIIDEPHLTIEVPQKGTCVSTPEVQRDGTTSYTWKCEPVPHKQRINCQARDIICL